MKNSRIIKVIGLVILVGLLGISSVLGQIEDTRNSKDKTMRSGAKVNPTTLGLELSIPLGNLPGRAGNSTPISFNYSSKLWQMDDYRYTDAGGLTYLHVYPSYSVNRSISGWTSSTRMPYVEDVSQRYYVYANNGGGNNNGGTNFCTISGMNCLCSSQGIQCFGGGGDNQGMMCVDPMTMTVCRCTASGTCCGQFGGEACPPNTNSNVINSLAHTTYYILPKYTVTLSDGSVYTLVGNANPNPTLVPANTVEPVFTNYHSLDGSNLKLVLVNETTKVLYLPNGSRYIFEITPNYETKTTFIDVNGNKVVNEMLPDQNGNFTRQLTTDTLGRQIDGNGVSYLAGNANIIIPDDVDYKVPGLAGEDLKYTFKWRKLEDAFANPSYSIKNLNQLFAYSPPFTFPPHNPMVLKEIVLPNGKSYQFGYNEYGEIEKIVNPSGSIETFQYQMIPMFGERQRLNAQFAFGQGNRGISTHTVLENPNSTPMQWHYNVPKNASTLIADQPYRIEATAPDGSLTKRYIFAEPLLPTTGIAQNIPRLSSVLAGRVYREEFYDSSNSTVPRSINLTKWAGAGQINSNETPRPDVKSYPKVERTASIVFENGQSVASSQTFVYGDYMNVISQTSYDFVPNINTTDIDSIPLGTPLKTTETSYVTDSNYINQQMVSLPKEGIIREGNQNGQIIAKTQTIYDNYTGSPTTPYPFSSPIHSYSGIGASMDCSTNSTPKICWQNPNNAYRGHPTTSRVWNNDDNTWIETHSQTDMFGNPIKAVDAIGNEATTEFSSEYKYAYPTKTITPAPDPDNSGHGTNQTSTTQTKYDFTTGLPLEVTDDFGQTIKTEYDQYLRPFRTSGVNVNVPISETFYDDVNLSWVKVRKQIDETNWDEAITYTDSLGRTVKTIAKDSQGSFIYLYKSLIISNLYLND